MDGDWVVGSFGYPASRKKEPRIRIATGDYLSLKFDLGRDDALATILYSIARQVARYQIWVKTGKQSDTGVGQRAHAMVRRYLSSTDHP
jgi:hypothetical protein